MLKTGKGCGDPGRAMFFDYLGRYFSQEPKLVRLPIGTVCPECGVDSVQLWRSKAGAPQCIAQNTITRKRFGRKSPEEPCAPMNDSTGMCSFGLGSMLVCGPFVAEATTRLAPDQPVPEHVSISFPERGDTARFIRRLVEAPPEPPFVAVVFGRKSSFKWSVTQDRSLVSINGPEPLEMAPAAVLSLALLLKDIKVNDVARLLTLRTRMALGEASETDCRQLDDFLEQNPDIAPAMPRLPAPGTTSASILQSVLAP
ncbi:MAG: hypothetical protein ACR652_02520 [Methylocystis sp.]|uniref:hypothetical protein n=1 Tax=Methylocystis sp. TaxID=1911079 RepID=UPI003DA4127A